ncbi:MAG: hypothetical protein NTY80_00670 [candidate division SR1 bacterium]|nr:hypothetical protein [candidate division SR1 bacterium]
MTATNNIQAHVTNPQVLKDMPKYLGNPQTIKDLYEALNKMPREEFYDLHENELAGVFGLYMALNTKFDSDINNDIMTNKVNCMLRLRRDVEKMINELALALRSYEEPGYFTEQEKDKKILFEKQIKYLFTNIFNCFISYKKRLTIDEIRSLKYDISNRSIGNIESISINSMTYIFSLLLQKHIYTGTESIDKALQHLMKISGENVTRSLFGGLENVSMEYISHGLLFIQYGFGQITIDAVLEGLQLIIKKNNEILQKYLESAIPLYTRLTEVLKKTNDDGGGNEELVILDPSASVVKVEKELDIKTINELTLQNDCLKIILRTDKTVLEQKLQPLKDICDLSKMNDAKLID